MPHPPIWVGAPIWVVFCIPSSALSPLAGAPVLTDKNKSIPSKIGIPDQKTSFSTSMSEMYYNNSNN